MKDRRSKLCGWLGGNTGKRKHKEKEDMETTKFKEL